MSDRQPFDMPPTRAQLGHVADQDHPLGNKCMPASTGRAGLAWLVLCVCCSCSHGGAPAQPESAGGAQAPWLEDGIPSGEPYEVNGGPLGAVGHGLALAGRPPDVALVSADVGLMGYLRLPRDVSWTGLGEDDAILAATRTGVLLVADTPAAAIAGDFYVRATVPGARMWDSAGALVVAANEREVHVSADGGRHYSVSSPATEAIAYVLARPPSTVAALARDADGAAPRGIVWTSVNAGSSWRRSDYRPLRLRRLGAWITDEVRACPAMLAADGTWRVVHASVLADLERRWLTWPSGQTSSEPRYRGAGYPLVLDDVPPVADSGPVVGHPCRRAVPPGPGPAAPPPPGAPPSAGAAGDEAVIVGGPLLPQGDAPIVTRTRFELADDGVCPGVTAEGRCAGEATRDPHVVVKDLLDATATVGALPERCHPLRVLSARGLGILQCVRGAALDIMVADRTLRWRSEVSLLDRPGELTEVDVATDGTVVLASPCEASGHCVAMVRAPKAVGTADAWWRPAFARATGFRALPAGDALAIVVGAEVSGRACVELWRLTRAQTPSLVTCARVVVPLETLSVTGDAVRLNGGLVRLSRLSSPADAGRCSADGEAPSPCAALYGPSGRTPRE